MEFSFNFVWKFWKLRLLFCCRCRLLLFVLPIASNAHSLTIHHPYPNIHRTVCRVALPKHLYCRVENVVLIVIYYFSGRGLSWTIIAIVSQSRLVRHAYVICRYTFIDLNFRFYGEIYYMIMHVWGEPARARRVFIQLIV